METKRQTEGVSKKMISSSLRLSRCYVDATTCTDDSTSSCSSSSKIDSWRHNIGTRHQPQCWNGYCLLVRQPARKKLPYFLMLDILPSSDLCKHLESGFSACFVDRTNRKLFSPHLSSILFDGCCFLLLIFFIFFFFSVNGFENIDRRGSDLVEEKFCLFLIFFQLSPVLKLLVWWVWFRPFSFLCFRHVSLRSNSRWWWWWWCGEILL